MFGTGISKEGDILDLAAENSIVNKSGAWYAYEGNKIGQGRENAKQVPFDNPEIREEVDRRVREHYGIWTVRKQKHLMMLKQAKAKKKADTEE